MAQETAETTAFPGKPLRPPQSSGRKRADSVQQAEYLQAPGNLVGIRIGKRLRVQHEFVSDETCPLGSGKKCKVVEGGYMVVENGKNGGNVWVKVPGLASK